MHRLIAATALLAAAAPLAATGIQDTTPATATPAPATAPSPPATPTPEATPAPTPPPAPAAPANPLDQILASAKPMAADSKSYPKRVTSAATKDCQTELTLEGGDKLTINLKSMQGMAVNTNLMVSGGGHGVQMEFDGKDGNKQAAAAEKAMSDLNDKCG